MLRTSDYSSGSRTGSHHIRWSKNVKWTDVILNPQPFLVTVHRMIIVRWKPQLSSHCQSELQWFFWESNHFFFMFWNIYDTCTNNRMIKSGILWIFMTDPFKCVQLFLIQCFNNSNFSKTVSCISTFKHKSSVPDFMCLYAAFSLLVFYKSPPNDWPLALFWLSF